MAIYAISQEGLEALAKLRHELLLTRDALDGASAKLLDDVNAVSDGLGGYYRDILELVRSVVAVWQGGRDELDKLANTFIPRYIDAVIEAMLDFNGDDDDWPDPPQKVKVLRR